MPFGPWANLQECVMDPALAQQYPDVKTRERICGSLKARLEAHAPGKSHADAQEPVKPGRVRDAGAYWLVEGNVAAREGVNGNKQLKRWSAILAGHATLEGAPLTYGHPLLPDGSKDTHPDPRKSVGHAVNVRADPEGRRLLYDAVVFKDAPAGYETAPHDLHRNAALVATIMEGGVVQNSVGYMALTDPTPGTFQGAGYVEDQVGLDFGHIAILAPIIAQTAACTPDMGCGLNVDEQHACTGGEGCCRKRKDAIVTQIMAATGASRLAALIAVKAATPPRKV